MSVHPVTISRSNPSTNVMLDNLYVLRDLPGVAALEAESLLWHADKNREWSKAFDGLDDRIDAVCRKLTGLTRDEACEVPRFEGDSDEAWLERSNGYAAHFAFLNSDDDDAIVAELHELGWDVCDVDGDILSCLYWIVIPIVAAAKGLGGRLPDAPRSDDEIARDVDAFAGKLLDELDTFRRRKR